MILDISAKYARLAYHFKTPTPGEKFNPRYDCIRVEPHPEGVVVIATNGHVMFIGVDRSGDCSEPVSLKVDIALHDRLRHLEQRLVLRKGQLHVMDKSAVASQSDFLADDQSYPDWRRAIPADLSDYGANFPACMNSSLLGMIGELRADLPESRDILFIGHRRDPHAVSIAYFKDEPSIMIAVMPLKGDTDIQMPAEKWLNKFHLTGRREDDDL